MQAPVIVMNDASARQTGRKAQTSNITAAKVIQVVMLCLTFRSLRMLYVPVSDQKPC
jgi:hypothetical protein